MKRFWKVSVNDCNNQRNNIKWKYSFYCAATLYNVLCNLFRNFAAPLRQKLNTMLLSVTTLDNAYKFVVTLLQSLRKLQLDSTSCNTCGTKKGMFLCKLCRNKTDRQFLQSIAVGSVPFLVWSSDTVIKWVCMLLPRACHWERQYFYKNRLVHIFVPSLMRAEVASVALTCSLILQLCQKYEAHEEEAGSVSSCM